MNNKSKSISLECGSGGEEMNKLIKSITNCFYKNNKWDNSDNDSATFKLPNGDFLCFTTDSFIVNPIEFSGGNIGKIAICGTINDLVVMGCDPVGLSLSLIIEEGFSQEILKRIIKSINDISTQFKIPIVTGDTKVMEKGSVDKITINISGVGIAKKILTDKIMIGDIVIVSGGIGEHATTLLAKRFDFETELKTDSKALVDEMKDIRKLVKIAKDPTRGGVAATINEIAIQNNIEIEIIEENIPLKKEVKSTTELLGLNYLELACEGRLITIAKKENAGKVVKKLQRYNKMAAIIGEVKSIRENGRVILKTSLGSRLLDVPIGRIVPRIC